MSQRLVSLNPDLKRLRDAGYNVEIVGTHLVVREIPYLNSTGALRMGTIATKLDLVTPEKIGPPDDHQVFFVGEWPCHVGGREIARLRGGQNQQAISDSITTNFSFSNKPPEGFKTFFEKIESYCTIICGPAEAQFGATPKTYNIVESDDPESPFHFVDTLSSRAEIFHLNEAFKEEVIAIIGLGGTGSYILDLIAKTPVREIRLFDDDDLHLHNAFRCPGVIGRRELGKNKVELLKNRYSRFHRRIRAFRHKVALGSLRGLKGCTFAFVAVDRGSSRTEIAEILGDLGIPFVDVGLGIREVGGSLRGQIRTTLAQPSNFAAVKRASLLPKRDPSDDLYDTNIQIAELNALNACLAVLQYKRFRGFYATEIPHNHSLFGVESDLNATLNV